MIKAEEVTMKSVVELRDWLRHNYKREKGVWVVYYKKSSNKVQDLNALEINLEAMCWGWIDSSVGKVSEVKTKLYIAPRKSKSNWSRVNKDRVAELIAVGRMQGPGLEKITLAKKTGTWDALNDVENFVTPPDLMRELKKYSKAMTNWENFPRSAKRGILEWILNAKQSETREKRIAETARLADQNIRANQPRQVKKK